MLKSFLNLLGDFAKSSGQKRNENLHNILPLQVLLLLIKFISVELMKICGIFCIFQASFCVHAVFQTLLQLLKMFLLKLDLNFITFWLFQRHIWW